MLNLGPASGTTNTDQDVTGVPLAQPVVMATATLLHTSAASRTPTTTAPTAPTAPPPPTATDLALGVTRDVLPAASTLATVGFAIAVKSIHTGFSVGTSLLRTVSNVGIVAAVGLAAGGAASTPVLVGAAVGAAALKGLQFGVQGAHAVTAAAVSLGETLTAHSFATPRLSE